MDERERYQRYLCGREWGVLKEAVRRRCRGICERCNHYPMDHVHHLTYARKYQAPSMPSLSGPTVIVAVSSSCSCLLARMAGRLFVVICTRLGPCSRRRSGRCWRYLLRLNFDA
jgi:hypothetical protein